MNLVILAVFGIALGSFVNALVWRIHEQSKSAKKLKDPKLSITRGRSMCSRCGHELAVKDLIPIFSWLSLGGKCRYCHKKIDDNPLVELTMPILFVFSYLYWPFSFDTKGVTLFIFWLLILVCFVALAVYDLKWMLLPDRIVFPLILLTGLQLLIELIFFHAGLDRLVSAMWGVAMISGLFLTFYLVSKGKWIGFGDVKLGLGLGILIGGPAASLLMLFTASITGSLVGLPVMVLSKNRHIKLPFGPFLILATFIVYLFGQTIINWYKQKLLLG